MRRLRRGLRGPARATTRCALAVAGVALAAGCSEGTAVGRATGSADATGPATTAPSTAPFTAPDPGPTVSAAGDREAAPGAYTVEPPGPFRPPLRRADVLVTAAATLPDGLVTRIARVEGVSEVLTISVASASVDGRTLTVAAVDPGEFRRFTPYAAATSDTVWERLAGGEVAVDTSVSTKLISSDDMIRLGTSAEAPTVHVGAYVPLVNRIDAVVNTSRGEQLGIPEHNALLVSTGELTPSVLADRFERIVGDRATLQTLAREFDVTARQTAVLTGSSVSQAVGTFSYTNRPDGEIAPDPSWVRKYIRTEEVPILGRVTCNKALLPQLRAALTEVVDRGLADEIHPDEYAGCYYPRYIGRDPAKGLSLHSWGIAVDLNVPGNLRGTVGQIDRTVVAIFKKWGFAWGGDWNYTDPMHFEMNAVVRPR